MDRATERLQNILRNHGLSFTKPRIEVVKTLYSYGLQTMNQLISRTPNIDRASVYRAVSTLEKIGAIERVTLGFKYKIDLSEEFKPHSHHIACIKCGRREDLNNSKLENLIKEISVSADFEPVSHKLELLGICKNCSTKNIA